jgi:hypothetical protein
MFGTPLLVQTAGIDKPLEIIEPTRREAVPVEGGSKAK